MSKADATPPQVTGVSENGKIRMRGGWGFEHFRQMGPSDVSMLPPLTSARTEAVRYRDRGLREARDAERNSELVRGALDRKTNTVVGPDLRPNPTPDIQWLGQTTDWMLEYQLAASSAFNEWANDTFCRGDAEGHYQFGGLCWQAFHSLAGPDAETAGYIGYDRERAERKNWKWATYVHLIDTDRISTPQGISDPPLPGQPRILDGREVDEHGAMEALHVGIRHPGDPDHEPFRHERIPRMTDFGRPMAFHWFFKRRPGLQRAVTTLAAVLSTVSMLGQHSQATLQNAVSHSYMAAYLKTTMDPAQAAQHLAPRTEFAKDGRPRSEWDVKMDAYEQMNLRFGNKRLPILGPNDELHFESADGSVTDFDPFRNAFLRELASALNISFEQLSLNYSLSSYSSTRSALLEAWRQISFERFMFTRHVAGLIYDAVIEEAFALGILKTPPGAPDFYEARQAYTRCSWTGPGMGWVDPLKEIEATKGRMGARVSTLQRESSSQGGNWQEDLMQASVEKKYAEKLGVPIDTGGSNPAAAEDADEDAAEDTNDENGAGAQKETVTNE